MLHYIGFGNDFLDMIPKAQVTATTENPRYTGLNQNENRLYIKDSMKTGKTTHRMGENICKSFI